jgi:hypothetical protein
VQTRAPDGAGEVEGELPSADEGAEVAPDEPVDALPDEDRTMDEAEVTRPIPVGVLAAPEELSAEAEAGLDESPPEETVHDLDHGVPLPTMTLARLALDQGDRTLSMATLEGLLDRDPDHAEAQEMLAELRTQVALDAEQRRRAESASAKIATLRGWLDAVRLASERRAQ